MRIAIPAPAGRRLGCTHPVAVRLGRWATAATAALVVWRWNLRNRAASRGPVSAPGLPEPVRPDPEPYPWSTDPADADPDDTARALTEHSPSGGPCEDRTPLGVPPGGFAHAGIKVDSTRYVTTLDRVD